MKPEYLAFRNELVEARAKQYVGSPPPLAAIVRSQCEHFSKKLAERFPHLTVQRGFYNGAEHWWCVEPDGEIVDPTIEQFGVEVGDSSHYKVFDPLKDEIYLGCCMNCSEEIYGLIERGRQEICSEECARSFERYLNNEITAYRCR